MLGHGTSINANKCSNALLAVLVIKQSGREESWTFNGAYYECGHYDRDMNRKTPHEKNSTLYNGQHMNTKVISWAILHHSVLRWPNTWLTVVCLSGQKFYNPVKWLWKLLHIYNQGRPKIFIIKSNGGPLKSMFNKTLVLKVLQET